MNNKISILFLLQKSRLNKRGKCPIRCRLTFNKKRKEFSTGIFINPDYWDSKKQLALPQNKYGHINTQLSLISQEINKAFLFLLVNSDVFDVEDIHLKYKGETIKADKTLLEVFELHNNRMKRLIGIEYAASTYAKFSTARDHAANFIKFKYDKKDILLESITLNYLKDFDFYCKSELGHRQVTINKSIQRVRKIIKLALAEGFIEKDPFILYKRKRQITKVIYLTTKELKRLESYEFKQSKLNYIKDLFIFCCYTGLPYMELMNLKPKHIYKEFDGNNWIRITRVKTSRELSIPILPKAQQIIDKQPIGDNIFRRISNQKYNSYLKEIADIVNIDKNLTTHVARKTFATTVLLYNDVPMEIVSELLGHSNITITQSHYGKIVQKKVSSAIERLKDRL
ncbi:MAG: site-specific integrase [Winogradskyella sp.]|uniref:site-specific integrase n=1 Tax=Winogradskyella sp. TaxID=1883156 RepID=UPI0025D1EE00|nr:site-specific integrase [Winogradskyella sp.]NRB58307.1 site-specific integrase [Winogradskyella sp.]